MGDVWGGVSDSFNSGEIASCNTESGGSLVLSAVDWLSWCSIL